MYVCSKLCEVGVFFFFRIFFFIFFSKCLMDGGSLRRSAGFFSLSGLTTCMSRTSLFLKER